VALNRGCVPLMNSKNLFQTLGVCGSATRKNKQRQERNAGISPLRRAMRLRDFGRDDSFFSSF
ncbi:MAG: hypothetical protein ABI209_11940, partial [Edaphobacter sp.]